VVPKEESILTCLRRSDGRRKKGARDLETKSEGFQAWKRGFVPGTRKTKKNGGGGVKGV